MQKLDFFLKAMNAGEYKRTAWVISAFSLIMEGPQDWKKDPYPYRIVQTPTGHFFVDPESKELVQIEGTSGGVAPFTMHDRVALTAGQVENLSKDIETTYGNILFNHIVVIYPFGKKVAYQEGRVTAGKMEELILERLKDNPKNPEDRKETEIYVDEYLKFANAMFALSAYTQLCVPACTAKTITAPPGIKELRARLLEENKDRLHDPAVIAKIDAELVKYLKDWMKDDPGMGFLIKEKSFSNVRRKLYLMGGAEYGMDDRNPEVQLVTKSLSEGWDPEKFAIMNTSSRSGSFSRGAQTELGGVATKWLFRASSNMLVAMDDCGSTIGIETVAGQGEEYKLIGFTAILPNPDTQGASVMQKIDRDNVGQYLGKKLYLRSPMYCKAPKTDFCKVCVGEKLATNPTGLSTAIAEYGSTFLTSSMKSMHDTSLKLARMDKDKVFI